MNYISRYIFMQERIDFDSASLFPETMRELSAAHPLGETPID
jgi:hypothetical protein